MDTQGEQSSADNPAILHSKSNGDEQKASEGMMNFSAILVQPFTGSSLFQASRS